MRIKHIEYCDSETGWQLNQTDFFPDLTLLIGVSGVGKTQILNVVRTLKRLARKDSTTDPLWGVTWKIDFETADKHCLWEGELAPKPNPEQESLAFYEEDDADSGQGPTFVFERLTIDNAIIIDRNGENIHFNKQLTPKLSPKKSALVLLKEEDIIKPVSQGFAHIAYLDQTKPQTGEIITNLNQMVKRYPTTKDIRESDLTTYVKLALLFDVDKPQFQKIISQFQEVFPLVEDVEFTKIQFGPFNSVPDLRIKEVGMSKWIPEEKISSGMLRTLLHIASLALWPDNSVILIDEFENSLGVNCLDEITSDLMHHRGRLQFIITSHHPYIINNIPSSHWKLVTRKSGVVQTINAADAGIGRSKHDAFVQLLNSPQFSEGVFAQ